MVKNLSIGQKKRGKKRMELKLLKSKLEKIGLNCTISNGKITGHNWTIRHEPPVINGQPEVIVSIEPANGKDRHYALKNETEIMAIKGLITLGVVPKGAIKCKKGQMLKEWLNEEIPGLIVKKIESGWKLSFSHKSLVIINDIWILEDYPEEVIMEKPPASINDLKSLLEPEEELA